MNYLLFLCLISTFNLINSTCTQSKPRKEGFLRKRCIPGYYEGSCLLILEKKNLHAAIEECQYEYGGRLATAPSKEAIQHWRSAIHFNHFQKGAKYWIGYGRNGFLDVTPKGENRWKNVFNNTEFASIDNWEGGANRNQLDDSDCPNYGTVFNPRNKKFDVKSSNEEHYSLCETVRWARLQCNTGWYLIPEIRMCVNVHDNYVNFVEAHGICNSEGSFIATAQNKEELEMLRHVIVPLNIRNNFLNVGGFWGGIKTLGSEAFSMDGTKVRADVTGTSPNEKKCGVILYKEFKDANGRKSDGAAVICVPNLSGGFVFPFMCQRFADQSTIKNVQ